jgi:hypothetical protein
VHLDARAPGAGPNPEVSGHLAAGERDVVVLEIPAHHDELGRADQLVPARTWVPHSMVQANFPSSIVTGTPSQREYTTGSVKAANVVAFPSCS